MSPTRPMSLAALVLAAGFLSIGCESSSKSDSQASSTASLYDRLGKEPAIQAVVEEAGFSIVRDLVGHGIGTGFHEEPQVPNYGKPNRGIRLVPGLTIAIEPMVNVGKPGIRTMPDKWTVVTIDGKRSAHFEHTVAITEEGPRILTAA